MQILSLQSRVAYGHVGNSTAVPVLQRLGHEVVAVDTTLLSNHLGYASHGGRILPAVEVEGVLEGLGKLDLFARLEAVLTRYLGQAASAAAGAITRIRAANPNAVYCLDPVMGERDGGFYVARETIDVIGRHLVAEADILLPNAFELDHLAGCRTRKLSDAIGASQALRRRARPGSIVIVTSLDREDGPRERIEALASGDGGQYLCSVPRLDLPAHGAGDLFAALFLGHYLNRRDLPWALQKAMDSTHAVFSGSIGREELALVASLDLLADAPKVAEIAKID